MTLSIELVGRAALSLARRRRPVRNEIILFHFFLWRLFTDLMSFAPPRGIDGPNAPPAPLARQPAARNTRPFAADAANDSPHLHTARLPRLLSAGRALFENRPDNESATAATMMST